MPAKVRDIGIDVPAPPREPAPGDQKNPWNGTLPVRGSTIVGTVVSTRMQGTAIVEKQHELTIQKFERIEKRTRRYAAHIPSNLDVAVGDEVMIAECRPLSKTVNFVVVGNRGNPGTRRIAGTEAPVPRAAKAEKGAKDEKGADKAEKPAKPAAKPARKADEAAAPRRA